MRSESKEYFQLAMALMLLWITVFKFWLYYLRLFYHTNSVAGLGFIVDEVNKKYGLNNKDMKPTETVIKATFKKVDFFPCNCK